MKFYIITILYMLLISCKEKISQDSRNEQNLYDEVMAIHDKVMPEMSTIHTLKRDLKAIEQPKTQEVIINNIIALDSADEAMMSWMAEFKVPEDKTKEIEYLSNEKQNILNVSQQMYRAIDNAKKVLDSLQNIQ